MLKKFIEFLEASALIILTAACVVGVIKHLDYRTEEPNEETPIIDELPGENEVPEVNREVKTLSIDCGGSISYEEGMTWGEWLESNHCDNSKFILQNGKIKCFVEDINGYAELCYFLEADFIHVHTNDLIYADFSYYAMY